MTDPKKKRLYGTGSLDLRKTRRYPNGLFWLRFYDGQGRHRAENSHTDNEGKALKLLAKRIGEREAGTLPTVRANRILVEDVAEKFFKDRRIRLLAKVPETLPPSTRDWRKANAESLAEHSERRWNKHLASAFGHRKAALITADDLNDYVLARQKEKAKNGTINRELALLRRVLRFGMDQRPRLVADMPKFPPRLPEAPREGFVEDGTFDKLLAAIEVPGLRAMVLTAYKLGFRKSELQHLLVIQVADGWISLFAGTTKNAKPRRVPMPGDVRAAVEACCAGKQPDAHVFTWPSGKPILDFRASWAKACEAAGVPDLSFHDLRRSAVRVMRRKGLAATVGMRITGHLTRTVFDQYDVAGERDLMDAAGKL